jgi:aldehyde:ferredoxin oxidoreductase
LNLFEGEETMNKCYAGRILRVDLNNGKIDKEGLEEGFAKKFLGGKGFGGKILYDEVPAKTDPFSSDNCVIISNGPLTGTGAFAPKCSFVTKSPLTGGWLDCMLGGFVGPELKFAGYDVLVISGKAPDPVYLWINNDRVEIKKATHLWGKTTHDAEQTIKKELGDPRIRVASIGPAGENLVRFACITGDLYRQAGRGGVGAVFGSKNLKALAVRGSGKAEVANKSEFIKHVKELNKALRDEGGTMTTYGTMWLMEPMNDYGMLPTRNFQEAVFQGAKKISGEKLVKTLKTKDMACHACALRCANFCDVKKSEFGPFQIEGPEYETACLLGSNCGVDNLKAIAYFNLLCDQLGIDTMSTGSTIAFLMECIQRKIVTKKENDGLDLKWGNYKAMVQMIKKISSREGIGDLLAEGVARAAKKIGRGASQLAMHVKGMEMPGYDPRGAVGMGLAYATADRGACHLRAWTIYEEVMGNMDRFSPEGKAMLVYARMHRKIIMDSLGICEMMGLMPIFASLLTDATGWKVTPLYNRKYEKLLEDFIIDEEKVGVGERIYNLSRAFNIREGFRKKDDKLPQRFFRQSVPQGPLKGHLMRIRDFKKMLKEYYELNKWDENGVPTREKLLELGLENVAKDLWPES